MKLEDEIKKYEEYAKNEDAKIEFLNERGLEIPKETMKDILSWKSHCVQYVGWLKELQRYRFEISECKAILDHPTPDVTENDKKRAMYVLQTFPDVGGDDKC